MSVLRARGVSVGFGGVHAVVDVDLDVDAGRLVGLIGPNGGQDVRTDTSPQGSFDFVHTMHPEAWRRAFPDGSLSRGRLLLGQVHQLGLRDVGADAEADVVAAGTIGVWGRRA